MNKENYDEYSSIWNDRYASKKMLRIFSPNTRYRTWRKMWVWLAKAQKIAGLNITSEQIKNMESCIDSIDFERVSFYEKELKHDIMAHVHAFGDNAPLARPIIHLGTTSADITDNADLIIFKSALDLLIVRTAHLIIVMLKLAQSHSNTPCLGFTHFQCAQMTTVGKRVSMWIQSLTLDLDALENLVEILPFRGIKGATGSADSFHKLFDGCYKSYKTMENLCAKWAGFSNIQPITGQTYDRKWDTRIIHIMAGLAESVHKIATDLRLLQSIKEMEEPFSSKQIGSSAMPYKRNPILSERVCSLAKFVMSLSTNAYFISSTQWLERSLDDSASRRIYLPQGFLACDSFLTTLTYVFDKVTVKSEIIKEHIDMHTANLITESILMEAVKNGADRQEIHEIIRKISMTIHKENCCKIDLFKEILLKEKIPGINQDYLEKIEKDPTNFIGFAEIQTLSFLEQKILPISEKYKQFIDSEEILEPI